MEEFYTALLATYQNEVTGFRKDGPVYLAREIQVMILRHLDLHNLLTSAQLVCREWRQLIITTTSLQEKLYFKPEDTLSSRGRLINPLLQARFPRYFPVDPEIIKAEDLLLHFDINDDRFIREEASWRRMLISQPSIKKLGTYTRYVYFPTSDYCDKSVQTFDSELRMEDYYTNIRKCSADDKNLTLSMSWDIDKRDKQDFVDKGNIDESFPDYWAENIGYIFNLGAEVVIRKIYSS
jgi:F-box-like